MKGTEHTLKSGRKITLRPLTVLDIVRVQETLPDVFAAGSVSTDAHNVLANIKLLCLASVVPRYWADVRPDAEQTRDPWSCPDGFTDYDLSTAELSEALELASSVEETEAISPLRGTATA